MRERGDCSVKAAFLLGCRPLYSIHLIKGSWAQLQPMHGPRSQARPWLKNAHREDCPESTEGVSECASHLGHSHPSTARAGLLQLTGQSVNSDRLRRLVLCVTRDWVGKTVRPSLRGRTYVLSNCKAVDTTGHRVTAIFSNQPHARKSRSLPQRKVCTWLCMSTSVL